MPTHTELYHPIPGGFLLVIEGIDGVGKTTLARSLYEEIRGSGIDCVLSKEPTAGPWGQKVRQGGATSRLSAKQELEYLLLDRADHVRDVIRPALDRNAVVILDRYYLSNVAYQGAAGIPVDEILRVNEAIAPKPDVCVLLDLPPEHSLARIRSRGDMPNAFEKEESLARCREIFLSINRPWINVIDASKDPWYVVREALELFLTESTNKIAANHFPIEAAESVRQLISRACG